MDLSKIKKISKLKLDTKSEFKKDKQGKHIYVAVADNKNNRSTIEHFFIDFMKNIHLQNNWYIGIDFEFNTKVIALMQIYFEFDNNDNIIVIIYPPDLSELGFFALQQILMNKRTNKILHGSESLDIPYLFNDFFKKDINKFGLFLDSFYDTKYLCEMKHYYENSMVKKCQIYAYILEAGIVEEKKIVELEKNEKKMGPIWEIKINIYNLQKEIVIYGLYDVIYLPMLLRTTMNDNYKLTNEITKIMLLARNGCIPGWIDLVNEISASNNYFVRYDSEAIRINDVYSFIIYSFPNYFSTFHYLLEINYFKLFWENTIKLLLINRLAEITQIYKSGNEKYENKLLFNINTITKNHLLRDLFNNIENYIRKIIT